MTSPREYNFTTDRIFANISEDDAQKLYDAAMKHPDALRKAIRTRFTSYNGFMSFYSNDLDTWLAKPLSEWDSNEIGTLLYAILGQKGEENVETSIFYDLVESNVFGEAWSSSVDWSNLEQALNEWKLVNAGECEPDFRKFPLGITDTAAYVKEYETMNNLRT